MVRHSQMIHAAAALALLATAGCAGMKVEVAVLDPAYHSQIQEEIDSRSLIRLAQNGDTEPVRLAVDRICAAYKEGRLSLYDLRIKYATERAGAMPEGAPKKALLGAIGMSTEDRETISKAKPAQNCVKSESSPLGFIDVASLEKAFLAIGSAILTEMDRQARVKAIDTYRTLLNEAQAVARNRLRLTAEEAERETTTQTQKEVVRATENAAGQKVSNSVEAAKGYLGDQGQTLVLSELAFAAASAEPQYWQEKYNVAEGSGFGGSTDMVIKLNSTADFSVKGLVFDARAAAQAVRKVTLSTVQLLASGSGMPIKTQKSTDTANTATEVADANNTIISAKAKIAAAGQDDSAYRAALKRVAAATLLAGETVARPNLTDAQRTAARAAAKRTFDANRTALSVGTAN